jgi:hypothetical protein
MFFSRFGLKRAGVAAAVALACCGVPAFAQDEKPVYSVSAGVDMTSHFVSYGLDVWGGGGSNTFPFEAASTVFGYATVNAAITPEFSAYVNVWSDINNNVDSAIGGSLQEVDLNVGVAYVFDKFTFSAAVGQWLYASDVEGILDVGVAYNDAGLWESFASADFALNPSLLVHYRFDPNGAQEDDSAAFVLGIKPSWKFLTDTDYPITLAVPMSVAFFTSEFQGGDSGYGYFTVGAVATVPLAFIPVKYGSWTASLGASYYNTDEDAIPANPQDNFLVTTLSVNVGF